MIDLNVNGGYYIYNRKTYDTKLALHGAIIEARDPDPKPQFWFHDDVYGAINWGLEPDLSIEQLYKIRAQQIRDQYDYLILMFSGGADSSTVLETFMNAGIHLDEVRTYYPIKALEGKQIVADPNHPLGLAFEYVLAALPKLKELEKRFPKTKISIIDIGDMIQSRIADEKMMERGHASAIAVTNYHNMRMMFQTDDAEAYIDSNKKQRVGVIYAADKPALHLVSNRLSFCFTDSGCSVSGLDYRETTNHSRLNFYWSRDLPLIPIKQSHMIKRLIESSSKIYGLANGPGKFTANLLTSNVIKKLIYPTWNINTYQKASKSGDQDLIDMFGDTAKSASIERDQYALGQLKILDKVVRKNNNIRWSIPSRMYNVGKVVTPHG